MPFDMVYLPALSSAQVSNETYRLSYVHALASSLDAELWQSVTVPQMLLQRESVSPQFLCSGRDGRETCRDVHLSAVSGTWPSGSEQGLVKVDSRRPNSNL